MQRNSIFTITHEDGNSSLRERYFDDIAREDLGEIGERVFVYMSDPNDSIEKSIWCYEHNRLPMIGEKDPVIAIAGADRYRIDTLITDPAALANFAPYFDTHDALEYLVVVGQRPAGADYSRYAKKVRFVDTP